MFFVFFTPIFDPYLGLGTYFLSGPSVAVLFILLSFCPFGVPRPFGVHVPVIDIYNIYIFNLYIE